MGIRTGIAAALRKLNPRGPNKFEPQTKAKPAPGAQVGRHTAKERERRDKQSGN